MYTAIVTFALLFVEPSGQGHALLWRMTPPEDVDVKFCIWITDQKNRDTVLDFLNDWARSDEAKSEGVIITDFDVECKMEMSI